MLELKYKSFMKKPIKNIEKTDNLIAPVSLDEFKFMLKQFRLKHPHIIKESDFSRTTYFQDLQVCAKENKAMKEYWVGILHNMVGDKAFNISRNHYKQTMESRQDGKTDSIE